MNKIIKCVAQKVSNLLVIAGMIAILGAIIAAIILSLSGGLAGVTYATIITALMPFFPWFLAALMSAIAWAVIACIYKN